MVFGEVAMGVGGRLRKRVAATKRVGLGVQHGAAFSQAGRQLGLIQLGPCATGDFFLGVLAFLANA